MAEGTIKDKSVIDAINKYVEVICKNYNVYAIILFGSYAKGNAKEDSDIDIAIITDDIKTSIFEEEVKLMGFRWKIDTRLEPHIIEINDYKNITNPFISEVVKTGIRIA